MMLPGDRLRLATLSPRFLFLPYACHLPILLVDTCFRRRFDTLLLIHALFSPSLLFDAALPRCRFYADAAAAAFMRRRCHAPRFSCRCLLISHAGFFFTFSRFICRFFAHIFFFMLLRCLRRATLRHTTLTDYAFMLRVDAA